jgi:hypothetical protein
MTSATQVQFRRGTAAQVAAFTGAQGETVVDTTNNRLVVNDGATPGGFGAAKRAENQRSIKTSADLPITANDVVLNINATSTLSVPIPAASSRGGNPLIIKIVIGSAAVTLTPTGSDTFDGHASISPVGGERLALTPYNDGVNNSLGYGL